MPSACIKFNKSTLHNNCREKVNLFTLKALIMTEQDPEKQETLLPPAYCQRKKGTRLETALVVCVPLLFVGLLAIVCLGVKYHTSTS